MSVAIGGFKRRQPKTPQSRRALKKLDAKVVENPKKILFLRGANTSDVVTDALNDLTTITKPYCKRLKKRNAFHAFEGNSHLEFLGYKNDCSLFCFGSDSKKKPHNLVLGRHFDFHVLDIVEFGILAMDRIEMGKTKGQTSGSIGSKPMFVFEGSEFDSDPFFIRLKNFLVDFFRGGNDIEIALDGVDRVVFISLKSATGEDAVIAPSDDCIGTKPQSNKGNTVLQFRHYAIQTGAATVTTTTPNKLNLVDIGPNFDFAVRRVCFSPATDFKHACKIPREAMAHLKHTAQNISGDELGNIRGQLHLGTQDVGGLNLRRFKAHKAGRRGGGVEENGDNDGDEGVEDGQDGTQPKAAKRHRTKRNREEESGGPETDI